MYVVAISVVCRADDAIVQLLKMRVRAGCTAVGCVAVCFVMLRRERRTRHHHCLLIDACLLAHK